MKPFPFTPELETVGRNMVWFKSPADAIAQPYHFIAHVLTFGTFEDVTIPLKYISDLELRDALDHAPPGVMAPRSWAY